MISSSNPRSSQRPTKPQRSGFSRPIVDGIYMLTVVSGVIAKEVLDSLSMTGTITFHWQRLICALIAGLIVYAGISQRFARRNLSLPGLAIAFQSGFFWHTVVDQAS